MRNPVRDSMNASAHVPANALLQNRLNKQEGTSLDFLHNARLDMNSSLCGDPSPTPFPSLTGLRSRTKIGRPESVTVGSRVTLVHLDNATALLGASPVAALQAAWAVILSFYTAAQDNVIYTTLIASPASASLEYLGEDVLHTTPTRICLHNPQKWDQTPNGSILKRLTESNAFALCRARQRLVSASHDEKLSKHGTMIALESKGCSKGNDGVSKLSIELLKDGELAVALVASPDIAGSLLLKVFYIDQVLNESSALVMLQQFDDVLAFILAYPAKPIAGSLAAIRTSLLSISNEPPEQSIELPLQAPRLQAQFEDFARYSPYRVALDFRKDIYSEHSSHNTTWTYEQLNDRAEILAARLLCRFGQLADEIIPICMERRPELYVAVLAILKTGGAWCPIDASFPARRRRDLIARTGARMLVVAEQKFADSAEGIPKGVITVDITCLEETVTHRVETSSVKMVSLAYLIWTSGTTGDPKGVPIHHEAAVTSMRALQKSIPVSVTGGIRCLQFSQFTFDVFVQDLFYTWGLGGTIISSTRDIMLGSFAELATKTNATHAHLTPAFAASVPRERCPTLQVVTMIGEKLPQAVADDWSRDMRAFNTYGPAETTVVSTFRRFGAAGDEVKSENIGFPLASVSAFVMRDDQPLMRHGIGELALGGTQLSKGYWNDPERSSERFVWNKQFSKHLYMTGDLVRQLFDGSLEFIGRTDDLIKIQGIRIELSEIGFSLRSCHPLIEQVEIQYLDRPDRPSNVIVAFLAAPKLKNTKETSTQLIASEDAIPIAKSAMLEARKTLPDYMIPRVFLVINRIPRTSSAKIDRAVLKKVYNLIDLGTWERMLASNAKVIKEVAAWSTHESDLITVVAQISGTSRHSMTRSSDLRSIGIDSIAATRLAPMLNAKGFSFLVADILRCQSLNDLLEVTDKSRTIHTAEKYDLDAFHYQWYTRVRMAIKRGDVFVAPALPLQEALLSESMQNANAYWSHVCLSLDVQVDNTSLHQAWSQVVNDTEALRTGFLPLATVLEHGDDLLVSNSTFMQLIYEEAAVDWTYIKSKEVDFQGLATERAHAVAKDHQNDQFRHPPLAVTVFEQPHHCIMMISIHHSVRDEASLDLILEDVSNHYQKVGQRSRKRHQLREALQLMLPTKAQIDQDEKFWSKELGNFVTTDGPNTWPDLTGKNTWGGHPTTGFVIHTRALKSSYNDLRNAALNLGASSVASILRLAWGCILLDYLETDSVVFAEIWSNRNDDFTLVDVVGPLMTVLPVPFRASGSVREALIAQSNFQKKSRAHRSIHSRIIKKLLSRSENQVLYPAVFNFLPDLREGSGNWCSSIWNKIDDVVGLIVEHPLALNIAQVANGVLEMEISANQNIMSSAQLAILALQVDAFVETMLRLPDTPLTQLSLHFPKDLLSVTSVTFSENARFAWKQNPTDWVDYYAARHPQWLAAQVVTSFTNDECESESWSFAELRSAYNRVAAFISRGSFLNQMIAVCLDRRIEAYAVILGILASNNTYLPIDEDLPGERKSFLLHDSKAVMLFTTKSLALTFSSTPPGSRFVYVDDSSYTEQMADHHLFTMPSHSQASDNAYLLYTSGSTGVPKGVLVGRGNLCSFVEGLSEFICPLIPGMKELPGRGKYLGLASRAFDVHIAEMFLAWRQGLAAVTAPRTTLLDNLELALRKLKITHASFVPSLIDQAGLDPANLPDLHYLGVGGENMSKRVIDTWATNDNAVLVNAYGPTEMSIGCTAAEVTRESSLRNVGRPYGNSVAHILVPGTDRYTLRSVAGELCFTGDLVANGYHNRADAKGFVDNFNGERMYRTGDIVRLMENDTLEYLRREDDQTKVRGQRLELGEISEAIRLLAETKLGLNKIDVATMVARHPKLSKSQLVSFFVPNPRSNKALDSPEILCSAYDYKIAGKILADCQKVLPAYMVPDLVIPLTTLPLAPSSGKVDSKRLKVLFTAIPIADIMYNTSQQPNQPEPSRRELNEAERCVRSAVISALTVDTAEVTTNTNLFRLGLDSLSAISLAVKMQKLGYDCTVSNILSNPLVEQLAFLPRKVQNTRASADRLTQTRSRLADLETRFRAIHSHGLGDLSIQAIKPCLPLQETLVATSLNNQSGALYVNHVALRLRAEIDHVHLYRAWTMVVADHEILRTCFQEFENKILQLILVYDEFLSASWKETAASDPESALQLQQSKSATEIISEIASKAPVRLTLIRPTSGDRNPILLVSIHHALYDRESIAMVFEELSMRYHSAIPSAHTPFDSMIEYVLSQDQEASKVFWTNYLAQCKPILLMDRADSIIENPSNNFFPSVDRTLSCPLTKLEDFSSSINGTLTSTIQAVFGIILAQTLGIHDVVFGAVLSGRTVLIENPHTIVAPCITTIPQRVNIRNNGSNIVNVVKFAQQGFVESLEFQHTALRDIHRWLEAEEPLFDCLVSYIPKWDPKPGLYPHLWTELEESMPNDFPLTIEFEADHEADRMRAHCTFSPAFGDSARAASLLENIDLLLGALVRREDITTEDLDISDSDAIDSRPRPQVWDELNWMPRELKMRELAAEICGASAQSISKGASFFSLGIDSITAIRFAQRLRQSGMECSSADVMRHSCIGALAHKIEAPPPHINSVEKLSEQPQKNHIKYIVSNIPILSPRDIVTDVYTCTPLQSSMLTQTLASDGRLYSHHHAVRLAHHIDLTRLKKAWELLTAETEILRTTFHFSDVDNSWLAAVHQESPDAWVEHNTRASMSDSLSVITKQSLFHEESDFEQSPWKTTILKTSIEIVLVISMHHSLYDGESISLLFQDLARIYKGTGLQPRAAFSDAARAISRNKTSAEKFWLRTLDGFEDREVLPSQKAKDTDIMRTETTFKINIESALQGCKDLGVTLQTIALLAYGKNLACVSGRRDVVFGHVVRGRSLAMQGANEIVGPLFNTVPFRIVFDKTYVTNKTAAIKIQHFSGESQPHQHASLASIQQAWRQRVGDANAQLFDTLFVFQNTANKVSTTDELWASVDIGEDVASTEYSTSFEFEQREEEIILRVASCKAPTTREQLRAWLIEFEQIFQDILEHPQRSIMAFPSSLQSLPLAIGSNNSCTSPRDEVEPGPDLQFIRKVLSEISGISLENIAVDASIFSLGLDSISAIRVAATCRKQGYGVSVADVLQGRCSGGICRRLRERNLDKTIRIEYQSSVDSRSKALLLVDVKDEDVEDVLPCLAGQLYHLASWLKSGGRMCEAIWTYQCSESLDVDGLRSAWRGLRERHSVLRTMFVTLSPKETVQVILKGSALSDDSFEIRKAQDNYRDRLVDRIKLEATQSFDFFSPPSKLCLVQGCTQDFVVLKLHHVTYDAWTVQTIIEDLIALYHNVRLPALPRFGSFVHHTMRSLHIESEEIYWRKSLKRCQQTLLQPSTIQSETALTTTTNSTQIFVTIKSAIANLQDLDYACRKSSISVPTIVLLAFARTLARHISVENPLFGLYQAGRSASFKDIDQLCAPCLNLTPLLVPDALERPVLESAQRLQFDLAERVEYEQSYLHEILDWVECRDKPLFNTFVNILSHEGTRGPPSASSSTRATTSSETLLVPCQLGDIPIDATLAGPVKRGRTAVDGLEVGFLAEQNFYLDVVRSIEDDCVDFEIRCDGELMDEGMINVFASMIALELEKIVDVIKRGIEGGA